MPRAVGKKPLNPVSGERRIATGQGQQGVGGTAVSSNLGVSGGAGTNMGHEPARKLTTGGCGGGSGTKESHETSHELTKLEEDLKTEDWPKFSGCIFDYARFRLTLNSFPPLKSQRVKGSRARLIAKFCLPWDRGDLVGWEGDEDAFWAEVKKTCLEEANVLTALKKR